MQARRLFGVVFAVAALGAACGPSPDPNEPRTTASASNSAAVSASASASASTPPPDPNDPFAVEVSQRDEELPILKGPKPTIADAALEPPPAGVPAAPKSCDAWIKRKAGAAPKSCATKPLALASLAEALDLTDDARDAALLALESCEGLPAGTVRSLRIELAPVECGDELAQPILKAKPAGMPGSIQHTLIGQALSARLSRAVGSPPQLEPPFTKKRVEAFTAGPVKKWFDEQAVAIKTLAQQGFALVGFGRGLVAINAGWADLRMVEVVRDVPISNEMKSDPELANAYYAKLDELLEPRKQRGRDAALVGLREMANTGILMDSRVRQTRSLLAKLYGGRRVDSLDILAVPETPLRADETDVERKLAAKLPTFFAGEILDPATATDPAMLAALGVHGIPLWFRSAVKDAGDTLSPAARAAYARLRVRLALVYWRAFDVEASIAHFAKLDRATLSPEDEFFFALAIALRNGPQDVAGLMLQTEPFTPKFGDVRAFDAVASKTYATPTTIGGLAAFDAAVLRQIAVPRDADGAYWLALQKRYDDAVSKLEDAKLRDEAAERGRAAGATAKILKTSQP